MRCQNCGCTVDDAAERGAYFQRVNPTGVRGVWECRPSCEGSHGTPEDALIAALDSGEGRDDD
jgi:hypothetical protein